MELKIYDVTKTAKQFGYYYFYSVVGRVAQSV